MVIAQPAEIYTYTLSQDFYSPLRRKSFDVTPPRSPKFASKLVPGEVSNPILVRRSQNSPFATQQVLPNFLFNGCNLRYQALLT